LSLGPASLAHGIAGAAGAARRCGCGFDGGGGCGDEGGCGSDADRGCGCGEAGCGCGEAGCGVDCGCGSGCGGAGCGETGEEGCAVGCDCGSHRVAGARQMAGCGSGSVTRAGSASLREPLH